MNYYDAVLQKEAAFEKEVDGIDICRLETRMKEIDWQTVFRAGNTDSSTEEKTLWEEAKSIERIVNDLTRLEEGKGAELALWLKQKFWAGTDCQAFTGTVITAKMKDEISQRFFLHDENIISADEAFRFLHNCWLEKQLHIKRRTEKHSKRITQIGVGKHRNGDGIRRKRKIHETISESGKLLS